MGMDGRGVKSGGKEGSDGGAYWVKRRRVIKSDGWGGGDAGGGE